MFGKNVIHSPQSYTNPDGTLVVTSIFYTLQGEGPYAGQPAVFVRLKGCNLTCNFCDTYFDSGDELTYDQIWEKIVKSIEDFYIKNKITDALFESITKYCSLIVITGGEPTLQFNNLDPFTQFLINRGMTVQIETNGVLYREFAPGVHVVSSPKINEKTGKYIEPKQAMLDRIDTLKFVVSADPTSPYHDIPDFAVKWKQQHPDRAIYVSPMNCYLNPPEKVGGNATIEMRSEIDERISFWTPNLLDPAQNQANHEHAAFLAMKHGIRLNLQTHLYASLP